MRVPSFDLTRQYQQLGSELEAAVVQVMSGGHFILGKNVEALEREIAEYVGVKYGIGVANGSDALHLALMALGVGPGDEVIVPAFTFFATAGSVARAGATPVFVDIDPDTYNIDPDRFAAAITKRTKAVIPVHLYGNPVDIERILAIAREHGVKVLEDCAQAIGAEMNGKRVGSFGDIATFSFFPTKNLGASGDAGMVVTDDAQLAEHVRMLRAHGAKVKYYHTELGYNSRLDELQAAILRVKLGHLNEWSERRRELAAEYGRLLAGGTVGVPIERQGFRHVYHQYTVRVPNREQLVKELARREIGSTVYYPTPLHLQPVFAHLGCKRGDLPECERACSEVLSLPMFPELTLPEVAYVAAAIKSLVP